MPTVTRHYVGFGEVLEIRMEDKELDLVLTEKTL